MIRCMIRWVAAEKISVTAFLSRRVVQQWFEISWSKPVAWSAQWLLATTNIAIAPLRICLKQTHWYNVRITQTSTTSTTRLAVARQRTALATSFTSWSYNLRDNLAQTWRSMYPTLPWDFVLKLNSCNFGCTSHENLIFWTQFFKTHWRREKPLLKLHASKSVHKICRHGNGFHFGNLKAPQKFLTSFHYRALSHSTTRKRWKTSKTY